MKSDEQKDEWKYTIFKIKLPKSEPLHLIGWEQNGDHSSVYFFCLFCCCVIICNTHAPLSGVLVIVSTDPKTGCEEYFCTFLKQKSYSNTNISLYKILVIWSMKWYLTKLYYLYPKLRKLGYWYEIDEL